MMPLKLYVDREDKDYKIMVRKFDEEKSLLGSDIDKNKSFYLIIDLDASPSLQKFVQNHPNILGTKNQDNLKGA